MTSFALYILVAVISIQYVSVSSQPGTEPVPPVVGDYGVQQQVDPSVIPPQIDPAQEPLPPVVEQQVDPSVIPPPIDTVTPPNPPVVIQPNEALPPVQEPVPQPEPEPVPEPANPVCDGSQVIYAIPPSVDALTGMPNGPGLDAITLSIEGINTYLTNKIGITSNGIMPDPVQPEIIRSASINPITGDLVLLYQEIDPLEPDMPDPAQRLVIIPQFKLNRLLVESPALASQPEPGTGVVGPEAGQQQLPQAQRPGILAYELEEIDLREIRRGPEVPLAEIAFDCAGNLLGVTMEGELVQMMIEPGSANLEFNYIGQVQFQGPVVALSSGFVGLTYDYQTMNYVAVGGPSGKTLAQFELDGCTVMQIGNPIEITDEFNVCPSGIISIVSRGNDQYYVTCADATTREIGLAVLELQGSTASILPLNAAQGQTSVILPKSSGGAIIPSMPSTTGNRVCFPREIQLTPPQCNVLPADINCRGNIQIQQAFPADMAAPGAGAEPAVNPELVPPAANPEPPVNAAPGTELVPPVVETPQGGVTVGAAPVNGQVGISTLAGNGYGSGAYANGGYANGGYANGAGSNGQYGGRPEQGSYSGTGYGSGAGQLTGGYTNGNGYFHEGAGSYANGGYAGSGTSFNGETVPGTETANAQVVANSGPALAANAAGTGSSSSGSSGSTSSGSSASGTGPSGESSSSSSDDSTTDSQTDSGDSTASGTDSDDESTTDSDDDSDDSQTDDSGDDSTESGTDSDDDSTTDSDTGSDDDSDDSQTDGDSGNTSVESGDDDNSTTGDDDDSTSTSDDDDESQSDDGGSDDGNSLDDDGDESNDDDDDASQSSESRERGSAEGASSYGNDFNKNGFVSAQEYGSNNDGEMISLSPTTLANLWGLALIFLGINVTFLFVCYYRNGNCKKNKVTMDDDMDADIESL